MVYRIDDATAVSVLPPVPTDNVGPPGFFTGGSTTGQSATRVRFWWLNMVQEELMAFAAAVGMKPDKANNAQALAAARVLFAAAERGVAPYSADLASRIGGYPKYAVVIDSNGKFWVSGADENKSVPGEDDAQWAGLLDGSATQEWANGRFATIPQLTDEATTRGTADATLQANINSETSARVAAISSLSNSKANLSGSNLFTGPQTIADSELVLLTNGLSASPLWTSGLRLQFANTQKGCRCYLICNPRNNILQYSILVGDGPNTKEWKHDLTSGRIISPLGNLAVTSELPFSDVTKKIQSFTVSVKHGDTITLPFAFRDANYQLSLTTVKDTRDNSSSHTVGYLNGSKAPGSFVFMMSWVTSSGAGNEPEVMAVDVIAIGNV